MQILFTNAIDPSVISVLEEAGHMVTAEPVPAAELGLAMSEFDCAVIYPPLTVEAYHVDEAMEGNIQFILCVGDVMSALARAYAESHGVGVREITDEMSRCGETVASILTSFFGKKE